MVSPDAASEIACPMVAHAVVIVLQLLPSSPLTPLTYHVPASAGEDSMIRAMSTRTTLPFNMLIPPVRICLPQLTKGLIVGREPHCFKYCPGLATLRCKSKYSRAVFHRQKGGE